MTNVTTKSRQGKEEKYFTRIIRQRKKSQHLANELLKFNILKKSNPLL